MTDRLGRFDRIQLRDWFAGQAMASLFVRVFPTNGAPPAEGIAANIAAASYFMADAMLAARDRSHGKTEMPQSDENLP